MAQNSRASANAEWPGAADYSSAGVITIFL